MARKRYITKRSALFLLLSTLVVLFAGVVAWEQNDRQSSQAAGGDIVGPPTVSATTVDKIFASVNSPMRGTGKIVEQASRKYNIDDAFAIAVWWVETNDGAAGVGLANRNPGGMSSSPDYPNYGSFTVYPSYEAAINDWFVVVKNRYIGQGLTSVYT